MGDWRAFDWEGSNYLLDRLSVGTTIHSVAMESPVLSPTSRKAPDLIRRQHIVVVIQERTFGCIFQPLQRNLLSHRSVSGEARAAQVYGAAVGELQVDGHDHAEFVVHAGLRALEAEYDVAACVFFDRGVDLVGAQGGAVDVFVKEPVQAMIALEVHFWRHVFFHHRFEIFGGGGFAGIGLHKILHGGFEILIAGLAVPHHHADHVKNVGALGIDEAPGYAKPGARVTGPVSHG